MSNGLTEYGRTIAPWPSYGDDTTTVDEVIENRLVLALEALTYLGEVRRQPNPVSGVLGESCSRLKALLNALVQARLIEADLLLVIQQLAPDRADELARAHRDRTEEDVARMELPIELVERGVDPERVIEEAREVLAGEVFGWRELA